MTATEGGPALRGADAAGSAGDAGGAHVTAGSRAPRLRTVLSLAKVEARLLLRSLLVLAGMLAGGFLIWIFILRVAVRPLWWNAAWQIGDGQLVLGLAVLVAAQLAAGRARRDATADLYASFPATAGTRTLAHLAGLAGALPASLLLLGTAVAVVQVRGAIGAPSIAVLAGGLLLVIAAGAAGIAIGTRFPHPLAGVLGALALFVLSSQFPGGAIWLSPWEIREDQLGQLPGPLAGYPPFGAHAVELASIAVLAAFVALTVTVRSGRARGVLATAAIAALATTCLAGAAELRPIPTADLNQLVRDVSDPASVQHCSTANQVRYCLYPGFGPDLPSLEAPVSAVLARLPALPVQPLTVRQVVSLLDYTNASLIDPSLTHGHPKRQVAQWTAQLRRAPGTAAAASEIYLPVASWPAAGAQLADAHFDLALAAAEWAVRIPPQAIGKPNGQVFLPCVPLDQAREAIAIWLAILATRPPAGELQDGLYVHGPGGRIGFTESEVRNTFVAIWTYPGEYAGYVTPPGVPQTTDAGYLLASAMTRLPEQKVARVLTSAWASWLNWHTTDAQLAAALGIRVPSVPAPPAPSRTPKPGATIAHQGPGSGPQNPLCTA